jgi:hypothetical protein
MDGDQGQGHHRAKDQKQGTRNCDALWRGQLQSVLGEDRPKSPDLGSFGDLDILHKSADNRSNPPPSQSLEGSMMPLLLGFP